MHRSVTASKLPTCRHSFETQRASLSTICSLNTSRNARKSSGRFCGDSAPNVLSATERAGCGCLPPFSESSNETAIFLLIQVLALITLAHAEGCGKIAQQMMGIVRQTNAQRR